MSETPRRGRPRKQDVEAKPAGTSSWWLAAKPGEMMAAAKAHEARMNESKESRTLGSVKFSFTW
jgi:hypothetical protein